MIHSYFFRSYFLLDFHLWNAVDKALDELGGHTICSLDTAHLQGFRRCSLRVNRRPYDLADWASWKIICADCGPHDLVMRAIDACPRRSRKNRGQSGEGAHQAKIYISMFHKLEEKNLKDFVTPIFKSPTPLPQWTQWSQASKREVIGRKFASDPNTAPGIKT